MTRRLLIAVPLLLAGCDGDPGAKPAKPDAGETAQLREEIRGLKQRIADLEKRVESPRSLDRRDPAAGALTDDVLIAMIHSGEDTVMNAAAGLARKQPSARVQQALIEVAEDLRQNPYHRQIAMSGLQGQRDAAATALWIRLLKDPEDQVVSRAANELAQLRDKEHYALFVEALAAVRVPDTAQNPSSARYSLLAALAQHARPESLPLALEALKSPSLNTRNAGCDLLCAIRTPEATVELLRLLEAMPELDPQTNVWFYQRIVNALGAASEPRAAAVFGRLLEVPELAETVLGHLPAICGPEQVPAVLRRLDVEIRRDQAGDASAQWRMQQISRSLGKAGGKAAGRALLGLALRAHQPGVAQEAANQLGRVATADLTQELVEAHANAAEGPVKQALERILRNGTFEVRWLEKEKRFTTEPLKIEAE